MAKKKKMTTQDDFLETKADELGVKEEYQKYLKDHARRLRELERQATGRNMVEPW